MVRTKSPKRLEDIVLAATRLFMDRGYQGARTARIAEEAGVAEGTLYLYAEGKEALFDLAVRRAFRDPDVDEPRLPHRVHDRSSVIASAWEAARRQLRFPLLWSEPESGAPDDVRAEFRALLRELYDTLASCWQGIRVVEKCAAQWPELHAYFYGELRRSGLARWEAYIRTRASGGYLREVPDARTAAVAVLELTAFFAVHRHTAPDQMDFDATTARETTVTLLCRGFLHEA